MAILKLFLILFLPHQLCSFHECEQIPLLIFLEAMDYDVLVVDRFDIRFRSDYAASGDF